MSTGEPGARAPGPRILVAADRAATRADGGARLVCPCPSRCLVRLAGNRVALVLTTACSYGNPADPARGCTLVGCEDGLKIDVEPASGWPEGHYRLSIDLDQGRVTCRASLPLPGCDAGRAVACEPAGVVTVVENGCALPATAQGFPQISFEKQLRPRKVRVSIVEP